MRIKTLANPLEDFLGMTGLKPTGTGVSCTPGRIGRWERSGYIFKKNKTKNQNLTVCCEEAKLTKSCAVILCRLVSFLGCCRAAFMLPLFRTGVTALSTSLPSEHCWGCGT